ncbi:hypothetical protein UY3_12544 [Chelonia mydas]|uniref:Uncharacterized protein n=1 Tax=Chelonia mydas TaxID=8469 RepID=M7BDW8_CHEMY|nr:hypothetical protein UY3_12544 [Chelonia mydas]
MVTSQLEEEERMKLSCYFCKTFSWSSFTRRSTGSGLGQLALTGGTGHMQNWKKQQSWQNFRMRNATFLEFCADLTLELQQLNTNTRSLLITDKGVARKLDTPECNQSVANQFGVGRSTVGAVVMGYVECVLFLSATSGHKKMGMKDRCHNSDPKQCRMKLKELRQADLKTREANGRSGSEPKTCHFYDELHAILGGSATTTPAVLFDSFDGDGDNTEAGFGDQEDDDDEVVSSSQQASGETGFPDSQELFLTLDLEPVLPEPTHGCLLDLPGGEGTSGECTF